MRAAPLWLEKHQNATCTARLHFSTTNKFHCCSFKLSSFACGLLCRVCFLFLAFLLVCCSSIETGQRNELYIIHATYMFSSFCQFNEICEINEYLWTARGLWSRRIFANSMRCVKSTNIWELHDVTSWSSVTTVCSQSGLRTTIIFQMTSTLTRFVKSSNICEIREICEVNEYVWTARDLWSQG